MKNSKKLLKNGPLSAVRASALTLAIMLGVLGAPAIAFAADDAGATVAADAGAVVAAAEPAPAPAAPVEATVSAEAPAAPAVVPAAQTSLDKLSSEIMNILIPVFSALMLGLSTLLLNWVRKKFKLDVSDKQISQWSMVAELAAGRGGEWARNKIKDLAEGETLPGPDVLEVAVNWAIDYGVAHGLPEMGREKLAGLIESKLHVKREAAGES
jgi:hypothetical protein